MKYKFLKATGEIYEEVIRLLEDNSLPTSDLAGKELYALLDEDGKLLGSGGLEIFGNKTLVRSVCIIKEMQGHGLGRIINKELEKIAAGKNIHELFLLTTTAKKFFEQQKYSVIDRSAVPEVIQKSSEFSEVCPSSATVMKKALL